ncbi:pimeloyl-ACP methyl ester carboxylesterase [Stella humosa]|uniref:Palmitoyl-protein thioesterase ABHD10, mitochondrial n=1 Tax=Stella humosa TaxID=94 RepID=A0A3N1LN52_9PROT|nr:alpha/beta hydrolase [Stella humosa]ROP90645.1 pimeloyl-ACP methyl ester carboxylesterase [Stella humosa]BBK29457.1 alpha/beta hydrolase [Stella humosa]
MDEGFIEQMGERIAYVRTAGTGPGVVFLGGFMSDMTGTKATALEAACRAAGRPFLRFDYRGHGQSSGRFVDGTIGAWADDAILALDRLTSGPQILVGSSMGGWLMLLAALARPGRVAGLVGLAAAPDFTEDLMWNEFPEPVRRTLLRDGVWNEPSEYGDEPYPITLRLIEEGRRHLVLRDTLPIACPLRLIHGLQDRDVPWQVSQRLLEHIDATDAALTLVKEGDHRLSRPPDLARLVDTVTALADQAAAELAEAGQPPDGPGAGSVAAIADSPSR